MTRGLVAIVKNEAHRIRDCIVSARLAGVTVATIVDTGSTDGTQSVIREACEGINLRLHERPWVNFGHNRSEAFALALGSADWLIATDADMTWQWDADFDPDPAVDAYEIAMHHGDLDYRLPLLLNGHREWESVGAVHEYTRLVGGSLGVRRPTDAVRVAYVHDPGTPDKAAWHAWLLEDELERDPENPRTVFYLAQTYREMGRTDQAVALYARRATMGGWEEERWYAAWQAAAWSRGPQRRTALLECWEQRPWRLEPLYDLVTDLNRAGQYPLAYALSGAARPRHGDILFVHQWVWDRGMDEQRAIAERGVAA